ncbi:MAG: phage minor head protein [Methylovulum sp.]|uniref:phage head morphogenesis protein n=1 Tax=Methylovulum sp. TaxID=1916980 RepID=UPI002616E185|nr:phage minor head protein [Methylovulum sp.]MDD2725398.1 phage minor head protein [Methylovulum sp.]MDD5124349.1 phage minor head protein [Methylovulum sp.]
MPPPLSFNTDGSPIHFLEAIRAAEARNIALPDVYYGQLQGLARQKAFSIAGIAAYDQLRAVLDDLNQAQANGQTFKQWRRNQSVKALELPLYRLENIFRTNIQGQYMAGRWEQITRTQDSRPYLMYDAINDSRTRPAHKALDGFIRPVNDPIWRRISPLNGYRCRCGLISLTEAQAKARSADGKGIDKVYDPETMQPDAGWDYSPQDRLLGVNKAIADRQGGGVLSSTLDGKLNDVLIMNTVDLPELAAVQRKMLEIARDKAEWFPVGFEGLYAVARDDLFAATAGNAIHFSMEGKLVAGFRPAIDLASAFTKAKVGGQLTFNEEYAVETLWHEMKHMAYKHETVPTKPVTRTAMEASVQFVARHSYLALLQELGLNSANQAEIIVAGHAYDVEVANYRQLLKQLKIDIGRAVVVIDNVLKNNADTNALIAELASALAKESGIADSRIEYGLKQLDRVSGFSERFKQKLNY